MKIKWSVFILLVFLVVCFVNSSDSGVNSLTDILNYCPSGDLDKNKYCNYRGSSYTRRPYWNIATGWYCYSYTRTERFTVKHANPVAVATYCPTLNISITLPAIPIGNENIFLDYTDTRAMKLMKTQFTSNTYYEIYIDCLKEAAKCCDSYMTNENIVATEDVCPVVWDGWDCWKQTEANTVVKQTCTQQAYSSLSNQCKLESEKECTFNRLTGKAEWIEQTNYDDCPIAPVYKKRHRYNVISLGVTNVIAFPAIIILLAYYKSLSIQMSLHRNLLIVIFIRNILTICTKEIIIIDQLNSNTNNVMILNGVGCRILTFFENVFKNGIYACMLVDGLNLHHQVARPNTPAIKIYYLYAISAAISIVPSIIWASVKGAHHGEYCWQVDSNNEQWIVDGFRITVLVINVLILLDIIRTIFTKMKQGGLNRSSKAAFRATLVLIPLFGLHFIVTADKSMVYDDTCLAEDIYDYARYSMEALQGIMVAILFCYRNEEVKAQLSNTYRKLNIFLDQKFGWTFSKTKNNYDRRTTTATYVQDNSSLARN